MCEKWFIAVFRCFEADKSDWRYPIYTEKVSRSRMPLWATIFLEIKTPSKVGQDPKTTDKAVVFEYVYWNHFVIGRNANS